MCYVQFKETNQIYSPLKISQSIKLNKAHVIEITKACAVAFMKARNSMVFSIRERKKHGENVFFKALANRFWLKLECFSSFNKVVHGRPSIKRTS